MVDNGSDNSQSVSEVITAGGGGMGSSTSVSTVTSSSSSSSSSVPELTVQEHENTQPVTTATSQASVTPINAHNDTTGNDITEEVTQSEGATDVITETFPENTASSQASEVNETFKKSETPVRPEESGDEPSEDDDEEGSASGEWGEFDQQRDVVYDADRR